jgi:hypothetical protein
MTVIPVGAIVTYWADLVALDLSGLATLVSSDRRHPSWRVEGLTTGHMRAEVS